ncbi:unnamed protein product [Urochloa humidicola]
MIREFLVVAMRAALEWALASLVLANGAAFCLIAAAAARLRLGPPCILCARVHRLLCSSSSASAGEGRGALRLLLCDAHLAAIAGETRGDPDRCDGAAGTGGLTEADDVSGLETHRDVSIGSEICEQDHDDGDEQPLVGDRSDDIARTTSSSEDGSALVSLFELSPIIAPPRGSGAGAGDSSVDPASAPELVAVAVDGGDELLTVGQIVSALRDQRRELEALRAELAGERRARAEAEEYQRQLEEQGELDREAARLAMQLVHESETEKHNLQRQLEAFRVKAQLHYLDGDDGGGGGGDGDGNNYQSLVDFLPGSVHSSYPDLANLLKLYTESAGNGGGRRQRDEYGELVIAAVVEEEAEEEEEEEEVAVPVDVTAASTESGGSVDGTITTVVTESLQERSTTTNSCHIETVAEAA